MRFYVTLFGTPLCILLIDYPEFRRFNMARKNTSPKENNSYFRQSGRSSRRPGSTNGYLSAKLQMVCREAGYINVASPRP